MEERQKGRTNQHLKNVLPPFRIKPNMEKTTSLPFSYPFSLSFRGASHPNGRPLFFSFFSKQIATLKAHVPLLSPHSFFSNPLSLIQQ